MGREVRIVYIYDNRKFNKPGSFFDLSTGQIDLEDGYRGSSFYTKVPISPKEGIARFKLIEHVPQKLLSVIIFDDYRKAHMLTIKLTNRNKAFVYDQVLLLYASGLEVKAEMRYL